MGARGPAPAPLELVNLRGNPGHRPANHSSPSPDKIAEDSKLATCPVHLIKDARVFWKRHAPTCIRLGTLTVSDVDTFAAGCQAYGELRELERLSKKLGIEMAIAKGVRKDLHATRADFMRFSQRFGLDPSSRSSVKLPKMPAQKSSTDSFRASKQA